MPAPSTGIGLAVAIATTATLLPLVASVRHTSAEQARTTEPPKPPETFDVAAIDAFVTKTVEQKGYVGLQVAVARDGQVVFSKAYGKASRETGALVDETTEFSIGSVTKQFACAALLLLADDGKLSMDDPVAKYFPDLTSAADITLADVGGHVAGYPDYYPLDFLDRRMETATTPDAILQTYATGKLDFPPRTRWSYSNTGYTLLGRVVEKVSGKPFGAFLRDRITAPLGMEHTSYEPAPGTPGLATGHLTFALGEVTTAPHEKTAWGNTAGGIHSTALDVLRWELALAGGKVLTPASLARMTTPRTLADGRSTEYGCGLGIGRRTGEMVWSHSGAMSGFLAFEGLVPRTKSAVVVLSNYESVSPRPVYDAILKVLLSPKGPEAPQVAIDASEAARAFFREMQAGKVDRSKLSEAFSAYLTDAKLQEAAPRLAALGASTHVDVEGRGERGGLEVTHLTLAFATKKPVKATMFRRADGTIEQFLLLKD